MKNINENDFSRAALICAKYHGGIFDGMECELPLTESAVRDAAERLQLAALSYLGLVMPDVDPTTDKITILD